MNKRPFVAPLCVSSLCSVSRLCCWGCDLQLWPPHWVCRNPWRFSLNRCQFLTFFSYINPLLYITTGCFLNVRLFGLFLAPFWPFEWCDKAAWLLQRNNNHWFSHRDADFVMYIQRQQVSGFIPSNKVELMERSLILFNLISFALVLNPLLKKKNMWDISQWK